MLLEDVHTKIEKVTASAQRVRDVEAAVRYALHEYKDDHRFGIMEPFLSLIIFKRPGMRVTPLLKIDSHTKMEDRPFDPETVELDMSDIMRQVEERLTKEKLTWDDVKIDIEKKFRISWEW